MRYILLIIIMLSCVIGFSQSQGEKHAGYLNYKPNDIRWPKTDISGDTIYILRGSTVTGEPGWYKYSIAGIVSDIISDSLDNISLILAGDVSGPIGSNSIGSGKVTYSKLAQSVKDSIYKKLDRQTAITGATKTKITYGSNGLVLSGADATTADIAPSTNRNYVSDTDVGKIANLSGVNSGDETISPGTGISVNQSPTHTWTITNTAPDVTVALSNGTGISVTGAYPNFTITNTSTNVGNGTVTDITVSNSNGFTGIVTNPTTSPSIAIGTTITGLLKGNGTAISAASSGTDYEVPLTFSTGLTRSTNTITVNTSQNINTLSNLTSNGLIKTSGGTGALSIATAGTDYLTPTGSGSGLSGIVTSITGTANQITASAATGSVTLSLPSDVTITTGLHTQSININTLTANNLSIPIHIGDATTVASVDPQVYVNRAVDDVGTGNAHCFSDGSRITRSGVIGYNSFDARITIAGTAAYDHYAAFQSAPIYGSSNTMTNFYGLYSSLVMNAGTITNNYGFYYKDPTGASGTIVADYGVYLESITKGTRNYGIFLQNNPNNGSLASGSGIDFTIMPGNTTNSGSQGNMGIGTVTPSKPLEIFKAGNDFEMLRISQSSGSRSAGIGIDGGGSNFGVSLYNNGTKTFVAENGGFITGATYVAAGNNAPTNGALIEGNVGIGNTSPLAPIHVGNQNVNNSTDAMILISRTTTGSGNGHGFADATNFSRSGASAYASYDSRITISGSNATDHYAGFQSAATYSNSNTMTNMYGTYFVPAVTGGGTITNVYGNYVANAQPITGTMTNNYGLYIEQLTRGVANFAIVTAGTTPSTFGGAVTITGTIFGNSVGANLRLKADGTTAKDAGIFANSSGDIYLSNWDANRGFGILSTGKISILGSTGFLGLGSLTNLFPAIKRVSAIAAFRLGDDSADAAISTAAITASGDLTQTAGRWIPTTINSTAATLTIGNAVYYTYSGAGLSTWTMPAVSSNTGVTYSMKNTSAFTVTINSAAGANDFAVTTGATATNTFAFTSGMAMTWHNNGTYWEVQ